MEKEFWQTRYLEIKEENEKLKAINEKLEKENNELDYFYNKEITRLTKKNNLLLEMLIDKKFTNDELLEEKI